MDNRFENLREKNYQTSKNVKSSLNKLENMENKAYRTADFAANVSVHLNDLESQFKSITKLSKQDYNFLFVAVALQCIRQYVIGTITQRLEHDKSDEFAHDIQRKIWGADDDPKKIKIYREEGSGYRATREEIINSFSVPYDVTNNTARYGVAGFEASGKGNGISGTTHRYKTLGHDPLFGWVFGTANIMTNTLTNNKVSTFHVKNGKVISYGGHDKTCKMFAHVIDRSKETPEDLALCLIKQGLHIMSDMYSIEGIALPGTVRLDDNLAKELAQYGLDFGNTIKLGTQASIAALINRIVAMVHGLMYDESIEFSKNLYSVRTRKILMYSNAIASMSNVIAVAVGAVGGTLTGQAELAKKSLNYLDIGGLIVTIHRIVSDKKFITEIEREFLENEWYNLVMEV